jgi:Skp family chaperone for outer membrane proteins
MKTIRLPLFSLLLAVLLVPLAAQTNPPAPAAGKPIDPARVAFVSSDAFMDETNGIKQLVKVLKTMETEFGPQQTELINMSNRLNVLGQEINQLRANPASDPKVLSTKLAEAQQLQRSIKQKGDAGQAAYDKRSKELKSPIEAAILAEFPAYIQARGISVLLDKSQLGGGILAARPELDVSADFVTYFNAKHP